jgi:hypothetical protein
MEVYFEVLEKLKNVSLLLKNCDINHENIKEYLIKLNYISADIDALQYHINDIKYSPPQKRVNIE